VDNRPASGNLRGSCGFSMGAGDGNRTRTVSLGICRVQALSGPDLRCGVSASDRDCPLVTGVNGPLMARICSPDLRERAGFAWLVILSSSAHPPGSGPSLTGEGGAPHGRTTFAREAWFARLALGRWWRDDQASASA
jgi:hypothetical protein